MTRAIDDYTLAHLARWAEYTGVDSDTIDSILGLIAEDPTLLDSHGWAELARMGRPLQGVPAGSLESAFNCDGSRRVHC